MKYTPALVMLACLPTLLLAGCDDEAEAEFASLRSPSAFLYAPSCVVDGKWLDYAACPEGTPVNYQGYLVNEGNASLSYVSLNTGSPTLVDTKRGVPGVTSVPIGERPSSIAGTPNGAFVLTTNTLDRDVSVVLIEARAEVARFALDAVSTELIYEPAADRFWLIYPDGRLEARRFAFDCGDGPGVYAGAASCTNQDPATGALTFTGSMSFDSELTLDLPASPQSLLRDPVREQLYVAYRDALYISVVGLEGSSEACLDGASSLPCETSRLPGGFSCADGLDNDGDGFVDGQDPQCFSPNGAESPEHAGVFQNDACTDGTDNDGDGLIDLLDPGCTTERDGSEEDGEQALVPAPCVDGIDNDGDGFADNRDPGCLSPNTAAEGGSIYTPACDDGLDNDGDGLVDFPEDPDCASVDDDVEAEGVTACNDGVDNDGDGLVDLIDSGCTSDTDTSELEPRGDCSDGLDNDNDGRIDTADPGCYGAHGLTERDVERVGLGPLGVDPQGRWLYVVDRSEWQVLVVDIEDAALIPAGLRDARTTVAGISVNPLPMDVVGDIRSAIIFEEGSRTIEREEAVFYTVTTAGTLDVGSVHQRFVVRDGDTEIESSELFTLRLVDEAGAEISQITRLQCIRGVCPEEVLPEINLRRRASLGIGEAGDLVTTEDDGSPFSVVADELFVTEPWTVTYEGVLPGSQRTDAVVDLTRPGKILGKNANYCSIGVVPGDHIIITSDPKDPFGLTSGGACDAFFQNAEGNDLLLEYAIAAVRPGELYLEILDDDAFAQVLPRRECFPDAISYEIRATETWIADGEQTASLLARDERLGVCERRNRSQLGDGRFRTGERYQNALFNLVIEDNPLLPIVRDTGFAFSIFGGYAPQRRLIGPMPRDAQLVDELRLLFIPDAGNNRLLIYDVDRMVPLPSL